MVFKRIRSLLFGLALAVCGEIVAYYVFTNYHQGGWVNGLLGITAFVAILSGILLALSPFKGSATALEMRLKKGNKVLYAMGTVLVVTAFLSPFVLAIVAFYHFTGNYHESQLRQYGTVTKVFIESEIQGRNARHDLCFKYTHDGVVWNGMLDAWKYEVGDSAEIIYSSQNPNEVEWYELYKVNQSQSRSLVQFGSTWNLEP